MTNKKITIFAAIHGDEVYGIELYNSFISAYPELSSYVQLVIGNKAAYAQNIRFIDIDMNRAYGVSQKSHEEDEIKRVSQEIRAFDPDYILDIHTTRRSSGVFFITDSLNDVKKKLCNFLPLDTCVMQGGYIKTSFVGNYPESVSLEYSLNAINPKTTNDFVTGLHRLVTNKTAPHNTNNKKYEVVSIIDKPQYDKYPGLKSYDKKPEGIALMVPKDASEMDAEYYGFWCKQAT